MISIIMDAKTDLLSMLAERYLSHWEDVPESLRDDIPNVLVQCADRIGRVFRAVGMLLDIAGIKGIADCQYLRNYKGPLTFERAAKTVLTEANKVWDSAYHDIVRTASTTKLVANKFRNLTELVKGDPSLADLAPQVPILVEITSGMRRGATANLEAAMHGHLVRLCNGLINGTAPMAAQSSIEAALSALKGQRK